MVRPRRVRRSRGSGRSRKGELLLPGHELEPVRLELVAACVAFVQRLPLCNQHAQGAL